MIDIDQMFIYLYYYSIRKYIKKLLGIPCYILKRVINLIYVNTKA